MTSYYAAGHFASTYPSMVKTLYVNSDGDIVVEWFLPSEFTKFTSSETTLTYSEVVIKIFKQTDLSNPYITSVVGSASTTLDDSTVIASTNNKKTITITDSIDQSTPLSIVLEFTDKATPPVKHICEPLKFYYIKPEGDCEPCTKCKKCTECKNNSMIWILLILVLVMIIGYLGYKNYYR
jgi:hypothetical protein